MTTIDKRKSVLPIIALIRAPCCIKLLRNQVLVVYQESRRRHVMDTHYRLFFKEIQLSPTGSSHKKPVVRSLYNLFHVNSNMLSKGVHWYNKGRQTGALTHRVRFYKMITTFKPKKKYLKSKLAPSHRLLHDDWKIYDRTTDTNLVTTVCWIKKNVSNKINSKFCVNFFEILWRHGILARAETAYFIAASWCFGSWHIARTMMAGSLCAWILGLAWFLVSGPTGNMKQLLVKCISKKQYLLYFDDFLIFTKQRHALKSFSWAKYSCWAINFISRILIPKLDLFVRSCSSCR